MIGKKLGSFIITYERTTHIKETIAIIKSQTIRSSDILIVDNSITSNVTDSLHADLGENVTIYKVGQNLGPAGAAKIGLQRMTDVGCDWIYWGDDDDPPEDKLVFERLLSLTKKYPKAGAVGLGGGKFNPYTGRTKRLQNSDLSLSDEVDFIPGNKSFLINATLVKQGILPSPELFFGFEELDYCLKIKKAGFKLYVDGDYWLEQRKKMGAGNPDQQFKSTHWGKKLPSIRTYYSARNMLTILLKNRLYFALIYNFLKILFKAISGFRFGLEYGKLSWKMNMMALTDFLRGKLGIKNMPLY
ncbi:glycosyltransferase [uncultured Algoriphagus sp.]|uniref:glycosyltransferase family 2 protein n=1 Tax=uncultured Algoriphagus sp. TaxID=417365 RepID=UPI0030EC9762|tara:strand:+ start:95683 stop:96585 length:903 start_codon:yes stop_codon:yes gene_type:complete